MSSMGSKNKNKFKKSHQFIKELLPAEWFPSNKIVIFFLGASKFNPRPLAMAIRPEKLKDFH